MTKVLRIEGACAWPLRSINVELPLGELVALTGANGAGKRSLAFDTIAYEGKRRLLALCARSISQSVLPRAEVEVLQGLPLTVECRAGSLQWALNATVGTVTGLEFALARLLLREGAPPQMRPSSLSFLSREGRCEVCAGTGERAAVDPERLVPDPSLSLAAGAVTPWQKSFHLGVLSGLCERVGIDFHCPWSSLSGAAQKLVLFGSKGDDFAGVVSDIERRLDACANDDGELSWLQGFLTMSPCQVCDGSRLNAAARSFSNCGFTMVDLFASTIGELRALLKARHDVELRAKLDVLADLGLEHLPLGRSTARLSRGETQRLGLAELSFASLTGALFVIEEPTAGLHAQERQLVLALLHQLVRSGNSVLAVTQDALSIRESASVIELSQGTLVGQGSPDGFQSEIESRSLPEPKPLAENWIRLRGANANNLRSVDVAIPQGRMSCLVGVSGAGKSSLLESLAVALAGESTFDRDSDLEVSRCFEISPRGLERSASLTVATCLGLADAIGDLYSKLPSSRGLKTSDFYLGQAGGRCPSCQGQGYLQIASELLSDRFTKCAVCDGRRFKPHVLQPHFEGLDISRLLGLSVDEALEHLASLPELTKRLRSLQRSGLGYLPLAHASTSLSDGELQRLVLAQALVEDSPGHCVFLIDDVSQGLHRSGLEQLLETLDALVEQGHTIVISDHHLGVIGACDHLIELGPGPGIAGGTIIAAGTPTELAATNTPTGRALRSLN